MKSLHSFIKQETPKFNKDVVEGLTYTRAKNGLRYLDDFIHYTCSDRSITSNNLTYLGSMIATPEEEMEFIIGKKPRIVHDISENFIYLVKFMFKYGNEKQIRTSYVYLPYIEPGNELRLSGSNHLVMPTLADKVISVGEKGVFINILTAKHNFSHTHYQIDYDDRRHSTTLLTTVLYRNPSVRVERTTRAKATVMHYLLSEFGYSKTMEMMLGYVPKPTYDLTKKNLVKSTGNRPSGWIGDRDDYTPTNIAFEIDPEKESKSLYCLGNMMYVLDQFPERITIDDLDNKGLWTRLMSEIIHSGEYTVGYLREKITAHFNDLNSRFDVNVINKLKDLDINAKTFMDLLAIIFQNYPLWMVSEGSGSYFSNKSYEVESFLYLYITSRFTRVVLDICKEELRTVSGLLDEKMVDKLFARHITPRSVFTLKSNKDYKPFMDSVECSGDHLYFKRTKRVAVQEANAIDTNRPDTNTADKNLITAESAVVGSLLALSKANPIPIIHVNPYVRLDPDTGVILASDEVIALMERTNELLNNTSLSINMEDLSDQDIEAIEDDDYDMDFEDLDDMDDVDYD